MALNNYTSDHRLLRAKIIINLKKERSEMIKGKKLIKWNLVEIPKVFEEAIDRGT